MASHVTMTKAQSEAVHKFLKPRLTSIDETVEELGQEDGFRVWQVFNRLEEKVGEEEGGDDES